MVFTKIISRDVGIRMKETVNKHIKVLLIEDNPDHTHLLRVMLDEITDNIYDLECAARLSEGLDYLAEGGIDVVLLDLSLPESRGLDTFNKVNSQVPDVPIIVISALDNETIAKKAVQAGAQDYLVKGQIDSNLLGRSISYAIERKCTEVILKKSHEELEVKVRERTVDLEKANQDLLVDMAKRKQAEEAVRKHEQFLEAVLDSIQDGISVLNRDLEIVLVNDIMCKWYAHMLPLKGKKCYVAYHGRAQPCEVCPTERALRSGKLEVNEVPLTQADGVTGTLELFAYPMLDNTGKPVGVVEYVRNITERKQAEERLHVHQQRLRSLTSELSLTEERERRRIATDLHDYIGQKLATSKIKLGLLQKSASSKIFAKELKEIRQLIEMSIKSARSLIFELSPPTLYDLGLESALEWLTEQTYKQHGISCSFWDDKRSKPLDEDVRVFLFQAVRELLVNIAKHGEASNAEVSIRKDGNNIRIDIADDGVGFDTAKIGLYGDENGGFGLFNIRERLDYFGGSFKIESKVGQGTSVSLVAPLNIDEKAMKKTE
jgi:PAS domain S-box-containing protein